MPDYGNWVSRPFMNMLFSVAAVLAVLFAGAWAWLHIGWLTVLLGVIFVVWSALTLYMWCCRQEFSFTGGGLMAKIHDYLVQHLDWDGQGKLLDVGCGSGALSIRCAKHFPQAQVTGMDYWGAMWNYGQQQCETNAEAEGVADRTIFQHGDASNLDFADETFDAVVSNFVFHEVRTQPDKCKLILEALRVLKPGGSFALQDLFDSRLIYGNIEDFLNELRTQGYTDLHYVSHVERQGFVPKYLRAPWMICKIGLIYGKKPA